MREDPDAPRGATGSHSVLVREVTHPLAMTGSNSEVVHLRCGFPNRIDPPRNTDNPLKPGDGARCSRRAIWRLLAPVANCSKISVSRSLRLGSSPIRVSATPFRSYAHQHRATPQPTIGRPTPGTKHARPSAFGKKCPEFKPAHWGVRLHDDKPILLRSTIRR